MFEIRFTLNEQPVCVFSHPGKSLLQVLREDLKLTGTKMGCLEGECGACSVFVNGTLVNSCLIPVGKVQGSTVITIEGLAGHPDFPVIQRAFLEKWAVQCGICIPGMIMATKALLDKNPNPSRQEIKTFLSGNLCRCTGYVKILEAVEFAAFLLQGDPKNGDARVEEQGSREDGAVAFSPSPIRLVGRSITRVDGAEKISGTAKYADDYHLEDMHYLHLVRSPHAHARILRIQMEEALLEPGVLGILTAKDIPGRNRFGIIVEDQPVLAEDRVRFKGEAVAMVVASSRERAQKAAEKVRVDYELLPALFSPFEALKPDAPQLHDSGNILSNPMVKRGDVEEGFSQSEIIVENTFETTFIEHAYLETEAGIAYLDEKGRITLRVSTQTPHMDQEATARILGVPGHQVRVIQATTGGGFGGKLDISVQPFLALAVHKFGKPVKLTYSREESFLSTTKRHPYVMTCKLGAKRDGTLVAAQVNIVGDTGAYASWGPTVIKRAVIHGSGPYSLSHYLGEGKVVYTNNPIAGAMRGFSTPQMAFATESQMDILATRLGIDPIALRLKNCLKPGSVTATGQVLGVSVGMEETLLAVRNKWEEIKGRYPLGRQGDFAYGFGVAGMWYGIGNTAMSNPSRVRLELEPDGKIHLYTGAADIGQGSSTVLLQILADEMETSMDQLRLTTADTEITPDSGKTSASRQVFITGNAIRDAAGQLKETLLKRGAELLKCPIDSLNVGRGYIFSQDQQRSVSFAEVARYLRDTRSPTSFMGYFDPQTTPLSELGQGSPYQTYGFGTHLAHVQVHTRTGEVKVLQFIAAHDVGRAINPKGVEGQIEGGVVMGLGFALTERFVPEKTHNFSTYLIPTFEETPEIYPLIIESEEPAGPFGAKGVGELAMIGTAPAIINAIYNATGARIYSLPATPEKVFNALKNSSLSGAR
ncbi:MAG TPA: molybdopterin cofactor-binding domain-containing protein [Candidatus Limnocylindrales bacterium]|nr:molybdopterin cofactor-binding domain-containing protein [Candidatus Limnocylindrales bacterium]